MIAVVAVFFALALRAEEVAKPYVPSLTFSSVVANKYLAFGNGATLYDKGVVQSCLDAAFACGLDVGLWNSVSFKEWNSNYGSELDYFAGWSGDLSKLGIASAGLSDINLSAGVTYFDEPNVGTFGAKDILYSHIKVSKPLSRYFTIMAGYENYVAMPGSPYKGANESLYFWGASAGKSIFHDRVCLGTSLSAVYDTGGLGCDHGMLLRGHAGADWNVSKHVVFNAVGVNYYVPLSVHDSRSLDGVVSSGFTLHF